MKRKDQSTRKLAVATAMAASLCCSAFVHAASVVGDWEQNNDGWFDWTASSGGGNNGGNPGGDPTNNFPSFIYSYTQTPPQAVTLGSNALKMSISTANGNTGFNQNLSLKTEWETDSQGNSELADFLNNTRFSIDVTYNSADWDPNTTYVNTRCYLNGPGYGFAYLGANGQPTYDTGNSNFTGGWDPTSYPGVTTRTLTWDYSSLLPGGTAATTLSANPNYIELILTSITNGTYGDFYFDNARFTSGQVTATWTNQAGANADGTYHWGTIANFSGGMPSNPGDIVNFGTAIPGPETITLNGNEKFQVAVGTMNFNTGSSYTIAQGTGGSLTLNGNIYNPDGTVTAGTSQINDEFGNHSITAPVILATNTTIAVGQANNTFTISGNISGTAGLVVSGDTSASGAGTVILSGLNTYSGGTTVGNGELEILPTATSSKTTSALARGAVNITGGKLLISSNVTLGSQASPAASNVNITSLAISGNGTLDITNNHIIINYGSGTDPIASIAAMISSGYNAGAWTGTGITSSSAAANAAYGIAYADAADPGNPAGLASGQIEVMYTLLGDANLDGKVNGADFAILATNFNKAVTGSSGWDQGDFNYDGKINGADFASLAGNFNKGASGAADSTAIDAFAEANGLSLTTSVPEPALTSGLLMFVGAGMLKRRRKA